MNTYIIKIALQGVSPMVWRRLKIPGNTSLAQLHQIIQIVNQWDDEYLHQFHIYGKDYGIGYLGGLSFADDAHQVFLDDFGFDVGDKFTYEYNFFAPWMVDVRIEKISQALSQPVVFCVQGKGLPGISRHDEVDATFKLLEAIANIDEKTTIGDIRPYVEAYDSVKFNRGQINHLLSTELTQ